MENIFNSEWNSPNTWPVVNDDGNIIGSIAAGEDTSDYAPVMVDKAARLIWQEMTINPDAYLAVLDIEG